MNVHRLAVTCLLPAAASPVRAAALVVDTPTSDLPLAGEFSLGFVQGVLGSPEL